MQFTLKTISKAGIPEAISKAELYRSLNEPEEAESICRDILAVEPEHQLALRLLGLASASITPAFCTNGGRRRRCAWVVRCTHSVLSSQRRCDVLPRPRRFVLLT